MDMMCSRQDMNRAEAKRKAQSSSVVPMTLGAASAVAFADNKDNNCTVALSLSLFFSSFSALFLLFCFRLFSWS